MSHFAIAIDINRDFFFTKLKAARKIGFNGVELYGVNPQSLQVLPDKIQSWSNSLNLVVHISHLCQHLDLLAQHTHKHNFTALDDQLALLQRAGVKTILLKLPMQQITTLDLAVSNLSELAKLCQNRDLHVALLPKAQEKYIKAQLELLELIERVDHPHLGLALNSCCIFADRTQATQLRNIPGNRIFHIQLCDVSAFTTDVSRLESHFTLLPGQGILNIASFVRIIARSGYKGQWSIVKDSPASLDDFKIHLRDAYRSLVALFDDVAQTEPALPSPVPGLPRRVNLSGIEFIEFAVDEVSYQELTKMLKTLAFRKERQHRSKAVELWRQSGVNIVVNKEKKGFAAQAFALHGTCVCDMALRVEDADKTVARATALGTSAFVQKVGTHELNIPAIKGVGGAVMHFIDEKSDLHRVWDIEFHPVSKARAAQPAGIRRIDHIAQTMPYQEMQSWLTYYLSNFTMEKTAIVDVADPSGIIYSQALASLEGEVRLSLNGAEGQTTFAGNFLTNASGAGVQHVAFVSDDIFETSHLLTQVGFKRLTIAPEYYDDLKHRFQLSDDLLTNLRAGHMLYDQEGEAEYFQIYGVPIFNGFFFEIVQRKGSYQGYGAHNAPIRLKAQAQYRKQENL